jgi:hypothetical protein
MPCAGSAKLAPEESSRASVPPPKRLKIVAVIVLETPCRFGFLTRLVVEEDRIAPPDLYQTFSLDDGGERLIRESLLDRFLACMKPAS